jgi:hypothetical protein
MKSRLALLLFGVVLFAVVPVWADGIHEPGPAKGSAGTFLVDNLDSNKAFNVWDSKSVANLDSLFAGSFDTDVHSSSLNDPNFYGGASSKSYAGKTWSQDNGNRGWYKHEGEGNHGPTQIPEPGSLWLSVLGMASVGFFPRGRAKCARSN